MNQLPLFWKTSANKPAIGAIRIRISHPKPIVGLNNPWARLSVERLNVQGEWELLDYQSEWGPNPRWVAEQAEKLAAKYPGAREHRLELFGPDFREGDLLKTDGVFSERIEFKTRYFVPWGEKARRVLEAVVADRPIIAMRKIVRGAA